MSHFSSIYKIYFTLFLKISQRFLYALQYSELLHEFLLKISYNNVVNELQYKNYNYTIKEKR